MKKIELSLSVKEDNCGYIGWAMCQLQGQLLGSSDTDKMYTFPVLHIVLDKSVC